MKKTIGIFLLFLCWHSREGNAQNISALKDSAALKTLQDSFCASISRHAGEESKDWGDAVAFAVFTKLDINSLPYRRAELCIYRHLAFASIRRLDYLLDSFIIDQSFSRCVPLWTVILKDRPGFYKAIQEMRKHPPLLQVQLMHLREQAGKNLVSGLKYGLSDSLITLFDRKAAYDSGRVGLHNLYKEIKNKRFTTEISFERQGADSIGAAKMKILIEGAAPVAVRLEYSKDDIYAKLEKVTVVAASDFRSENLIDKPGRIPKEEDKAKKRF